MGYREARESSGKAAATKVLESYVTDGKSAGLRLRKAIQDTVIRPLKVYTRDMRFELRHGVHLPVYFVSIEGREEELTLHTHAFSVMRQAVDLSSSTVNVMIDGQDWDRNLLEVCLNTKFHNKVFTQRGGGLPRFINLVVGNQVRGFVGRGFKRHLRSGPLLDAFIMACARMGAMPVDAYSTDLRVNLRCVLPYVFAVRDDDFVALGLSFSNSDFGAGALRLETCLVSLRNRQVFMLRTLNGRGRGEGHNGGSGEDDSVEDSYELSEETVQKHIVAKQGEVNDLVSASLTQDKVNLVLDEVSAVLDRRLPWVQLERYLRGKLTQEEMANIQALIRKSGRSEALPTVQYDADDQAIMDVWFAANALGQVAANAREDRKEELQAVASKLLAV